MQYLIVIILGLSLPIILFLRPWLRYKSNSGELNFFKYSWEHKMLNQKICLFFYNKGEDKGLNLLHNVLTVVLYIKLLLLILGNIGVI